jgi:hypothetical protein
MPCRNPCRLDFHLAITCSAGPSSVVWSELGPALPFPPMRVVEVYRSRALNLVCEVAFSEGSLPASKTSCTSYELCGVTRVRTKPLQRVSIGNNELSLKEGFSKTLLNVTNIWHLPSFVALRFWMIWIERKGRVFNQEQLA